MTAKNKTPAGGDRQGQAQTKTRAVIVPQAQAVSLPAIDPLTGWHALGKPLAERLKRQGGKTRRAGK
jgi:hypothetical protein